VLEPLTPGGPFVMRINSDRQEIVIQDILVGDLWLLGGQSNMELPISRTLDLYEQEVKDADNPMIRQFTVPMVYDFHGPRTELAGGEWKAVTPENVLDFSALGYFFAQELYEKYQVPIGLLQTAVGGTPVEAWLSEEAIRKIGGYEELLARCQDDHFVEKTIATENQELVRWYRQLNQEDEGRRSDCPWSAPTCDDSGWPTFTVPRSWAGSELEGLHGAVWFRKKFEVSADKVDTDTVLHLGAIIDGDDTYLNGVLVGKTDYRYPPRKYQVPAGVLQAGTNTIAVRVICNRDIGGFVQGKPYSLRIGSTEIDLTGPWKYKVGVVLPTLPLVTFFQWKPTGVYNGMIAPLKNSTIKGFLWYQGEANADHPDNYHLLFKELIATWRRTWQLGDLPFLFVQLPNYLLEEDSDWSRLREEQRRTLDVPNTAMAVTIDVGEDNDLHPQNKKDIGHRLALAAQRLVYGEDVVAQGPLLQKVERHGQCLALSFTSIGSGLMVKGRSPAGFEVCGADRKFCPATAEVVGDSVIVASPMVEAPVGVRYAWGNSPTAANIYNQEGLPASPFEAFI
jgi:sialate O-acetylesterase